LYLIERAYKNYTIKGISKALIKNITLITLYFKI